MTQLPIMTVANWGEIFVPRPVLESRDSASASLEWKKCIEAVQALPSSSAQLESAPNAKAIQLALEWLKTLLEQFPLSPPTLIAAEPAGGIIVERRAKLVDGTDILTELTFYNRGDVEVTYYRNGRIESMQTITSKP